MTAKLTAVRAPVAGAGDAAAPLLEKPAEPAWLPLIRAMQDYYPYALAQLMKDGLGKVIADATWSLTWAQGWTFDPFAAPNTNSDNRRKSADLARTLPAAIAKARSCKPEDSKPAAVRKYLDDSRAYAEQQRQIEEQSRRDADHARLEARRAEQAAQRQASDASPFSAGKKAYWDWVKVNAPPMSFADPEKVGAEYHRLLATGDVERARGFLDAHYTHTR